MNKKLIYPMHWSTWEPSDLDTYKENKYEFSRSVSIDNKTGVVKESYHGKIGLMCPKCGYMEFTQLDYTSNISNDESKYDENLISYNTLTHFTESCKICGESTVLEEIDPNIASAISNLNEAGYITNFCCEGHKIDDEMNNPYISFDPTNKLEVLQNIFYDLPLSWYVDYSLYDINGSVVIRSDSSSTDPDEAILDIKQWAGFVVPIEILEELLNL